jgi:hypothetical protein
MRFSYWGLGIRLAMQMPEVVVATPDRLCSLLAANALSLTSVSYVVSGLYLTLKTAKIDH